MYIIPLITYLPDKEGVAHINENCNVHVYIIPLVTYFPKHGWVAHRNENCNVYVYIIPLITDFPNMEGIVHRNENCNVCMYILFPWSRISPNMEGVAHRNENCNVCMYILFLWSPISPTWMVSSQKWELQCPYVYIIPLVTYFPDMEELLIAMRIAMYVFVYYSLDHLFSRHGGGCWDNWELQCLYVYIIRLITYFPNMDV